jgi:hypothetical protein
MTEDEYKAKIKRLGNHLEYVMTTTAKSMNSAADLLNDSTKELKRLQRYEEMVHYIANDYHELSYDKAKWQRDDWKRRCKELIQAEVE